MVTVMFGTDHSDKNWMLKKDSYMPGILSLAIVQIKVKKRIKRKQAGGGEWAGNWDIGGGKYSLYCKSNCLLGIKEKREIYGEKKTVCFRDRKGREH